MTRSLEKSSSYLIFLSIVAATGGLLFGYDTAVISGTINMVRDVFELNTIRVGWYVGCALVGSIIGVMCAGVLSDRLGRKPTMLLAACFFTISAIFCAVSNSFHLLVFFRVVGGLGIGVVSVVSPLYISEIAVAKHRGRLVSLYQFAVTVGFLCAYLINYMLLSYSEGHSQELVGSFWNWLFVSEVWRGMLGMEAFPAIVFFLIVIFIPESPRWLIVKGRNKLAYEILKKINQSEEQASKVLSETQDVLSREKKQSNWKLLTAPGIRKAIIVGVLIAILGQFMGVNAVMYYGPSIFESAGLSGGDSLFYQVLVGLVNVLTTLLAMMIIDKVGRKKLVYYGVSGMILSLLLIGAYFLLGAKLSLPSVLLLSFFLLYIFSCAISICAVVFVLLSEMYPTRVRGMAMSVAGLSLWIGTYLIGQLTPWLLETLSPAGTFFLFAFMCVPYMYIVWKHIPETSGKTLEEIELYWIKNSKK